MSDADRTDRDRKDKDKPLTYEKRVEAELEDRDWDGAAPIIDAGDHFLVDNEILLTAGAEQLLAAELSRRNCKPDVRTNSREGAQLLGIQRWLVPPEQDVRRLARELSRDLKASGETVSTVSAFRGEPAYRGGPGSEPRPTEDPLFKASAESSRQHDIAVLDTGVWALWADQPLIATAVKPDADDTDLLDVHPAPGLDTQAGHGTFIAGLVARHAPGLGIDPGKVLDSTGFGDDVTLAIELAECKAPVINMSLGGYTDDDRPPPALARALERFWPDSVVIAAAGNNSSKRPFWPAAFKHVIAVGALDTRDPANPKRADFSNFGPWVDVWAPGVDQTSTFVDDGLLNGARAATGFKGWALWNGTSFAAPLVAARIARDKVERNISARAAAYALLSELPNVPGHGLVYIPAETAG